MMRIKDDSKNEVYKILKEKGFKEDERIFYVEENEDCFALNKENNTFNFVGNSSRNIDYYIKYFELQEFIDERS